MTKILLVSGTFNESGGKASSVLTKISDSFHKHNVIDADIVTINGGSLLDLYGIDFKKIDILFWAPNVSNNLPKIIPDIKSVNPKLFLISSKRVVEKEYKESDVIGRLLKTKSNLGLMITKPNDAYNFQILDPLGNMYCDTDNIEEMVKSLIERISYTRTLSRIGSKSIGNSRDIQVNPDFLSFIKHSANEFSKHINAINPNRFLGNASTRCMFGFPAEKQNDRILVTQRNIDKQLIETNGFVEVTNNEDVVEYYGDKKPSVDTPIQVKLFNYYSNINYMVHGHVYLENAPSTENKVPCGYVEEFDEIIKLYPDREIETIVVNLKGHGCLIMSNNVEQLWKTYQNHQYTSRPFPESDC